MSFLQCTSTQLQLLQSGHVTEQALPPVPVSNGNTPSPRKEDKPILTNNVHDSESKTSTGDDSTPLVETSDGYALLSPEPPKEGPDEAGYDEVNDQYAVSAHYETSGDLIGGDGSATDDHDYEEPYWEPANKEEELMDQLSKLNVPVIAAKDVE